MHVNHNVCQALIWGSIIKRSATIRNAIIQMLWYLYGFHRASNKPFVLYNIEEQSEMSKQNIPALLPSITDTSNDQKRMYDLI